jgi:hypothetical protein
MVGFAQRVTLVHSGVVSAGVVVSVVDLAAGAGTSLHAAHRLLEQQRHPLGFGGSSTQMGDVQHVDPLGDDQLQDGFAEQLACGRHGDGSEARDVAQFIAFDRPSLERFEVGPNEHEVAPAA